MPADIQYQAADDILQALGIAPTAINVNLLVSWMPQEYTAAELAATNNPLATSLRTQGVGGYCILPNGEASSEPCYDTLADGAAACAKTIINGRYPHLAAGLQNSDTGIFFSSAGMSELCLWSGGACYGPTIQGTYGSLPTPPDWALETPSNGNGSGSGTGEPFYQQPSFWLAVAGGLMIAGGLGLYALEHWQIKHPEIGGLAFAKMTERDSRKDHRINPKWRLFSRPTEEDISEISEPINPCTIMNNWKSEALKRGVQWVEGRNLPEGTEAYYTPGDFGVPDKIFVSSAITTLAKECDPYAVETYGHEVGHSLAHNPGCLPKFRGVTYSSEGHQIEEQEAELGSYAAMIELNQAVELYDGTVIPPGTEKIDWDLAQKYLDPDTFNNVKYISDWLVRAARGEDGDLTTSVCPAMRK